MWLWDWRGWVPFLRWKESEKERSDQSRGRRRWRRGNPAQKQGKKKQAGIGEIVWKMEHLLGLLKIRVVRGINLAVRDISSSDPYVVIKMGRQVVYDKDTFSLDDPMGNAEFDIQPFLEAVKMRVGSVPNDTVVKTVVPNRSNCIAEESKIYISDGQVCQDVILRLRDVECGEVELRLQWVDVPNAKGL
ncbi:hypothetical protein Taro_007468 [Colocasia esculenta]|uniref:C2 domain-containing protein n=1 Tax=Colocasia esculenta TaxID=4460 RepID=A0A843TY96_COLES|nr:hypothetical protein [Colocasia esculenta]